MANREDRTLGDSGGAASAQPPRPEATEDRKTALTIGRWALVGALGAAVIGVGASTSTTLIATHSVTHQAQEEFLRNQRIDAYADLMAQVTNIQYRVSPAFLSATSGERLDMREEDVLALWTTQMPAVGLAAERVSMLAGPGVEDAAERMIKSTLMAADMTYAAFCADNPESSIPVCHGASHGSFADESTPEGWMKYNLAANPAFADFTNETRRELKVETQ